MDLAPVDRLVGELVDGTLGAHLILIGHHVAETLVVHYPNKNLHLIGGDGEGGVLRRRRAKPGEVGSGGWKDERHEVDRRSER